MGEVEGEREMKGEERRTEGNGREDAEPEGEEGKDGVEVEGDCLGDQPSRRSSGQEDEAEIPRTAGVERDEVEGLPASLSALRYALRSLAAEDGAREEFEGKMARQMARG